jgi:flagellar hook assembly protein FlgD
VSLTVHDVSGRVVRSFDLRDKKQGEVKITWDGRDESGSPVPSGVYFWRLRGGDFTSSVKMVKLKR